MLHHSSERFGISKLGISSNPPVLIPFIPGSILSVMSRSKSKTSFILISIPTASPVAFTAPEAPPTPAVSKPPTNTLLGQRQ